MGARVVAWDNDAAASELNFGQSIRERHEVQAIVADAARPTPAIGWRNAESQGLLERACGRFDCVMMLGLIHHLLISHQIPLDQIAGLLRDLTSRWAIVEWVPSIDSRFVELVRGRNELYAHLNEAEFITAMDLYFETAQKERLKNGRVLYLF